MTTRDEVTALADMARWCFSKSLDARAPALGVVTDDASVAAPRRA